MKRIRLTCCISAIIISGCFGSCSKDSESSEIIDVTNLYGVWHVTNITDESRSDDYGENAKGDFTDTTIELTINVDGTYTQINKCTINDGRILPHTSGSYLFTASNKTLKMQGTTTAGPFSFPHIHLFVIEKLTKTELVYSEDTGLPNIGLERWTFVRIR